MTDYIIHDTIDVLVLSDPYIDLFRSWNKSNCHRGELIYVVIDNFMVENLCVGNAVYGYMVYYENKR